MSSDNEAISRLQRQHTAGREEQKKGGNPGTVVLAAEGEEGAKKRAWTRLQQLTGENIKDWARCAVTPVLISLGVKRIRFRA